MMFRITLPLGLCALAMLGTMGCAYLVEDRAIDAFTSALAEKNYEGLRSATSPNFEQRALRAAEALDDFEIVKLPKGETTVVEVQDSSETEKLVTVAAGKLKKKLFYRLVKDGEKGEWVVDDVYVRQRKDGVKVDKSVAEQMDLLLNVREFLTLWHEGTREEVFSVATPELAAVLGELPPMHLSRLCRQVVGEHVDEKRFHPRAQLDSDVAVVTLPRKTGKMILSYKLLDGEWKVSDVAVESKKDQEHITSVMKTATVIRGAVKFLEAYSARDKQRLEKVCHKKFYESSILPGDLSTVALPDQFISSGQYHIKMEGSHADFVIEEPNQVVKIGLSRDVSNDPLNKETVYVIDDVTIYPNSAEGGELQEMRLSMVFTGHAVLHLFRESLAEGNLPLLKQTATHDFNRRVWQRIEEEALAEFTPRIMTNRIEENLAAEYDGAICKLTVRQLGLPVTYVLRDRKGEVAVDDVIIHPSDENVVDISGEVTSMKETLELMIPLRVFREALAKSDLETLQRTSSSELNRMIWKQADGVPEGGRAAVKNLLAPLNKIERLDEGKSLVSLGSRSFGCSVMLVTEHDHQVVDDIVLIDGVQPELRARFKHKMRDEISIGGPSQGEIMQAGNWRDAPESRADEPVPSADLDQFVTYPEMPAPVPLPTTQRPLPTETRSSPTEQSPPMTPAGTAAPPLFPGGEADLGRVPEIKPSDNAFDSPVDAFND